MNINYINIYVYLPKLGEWNRARIFTIKVRAKNTTLSIFISTEACGIELKGDNKWTTLIYNVSMNTKQFKI